MGRKKFKSEEVAGITGTNELTIFMSRFVEWMRVRGLSIFTIHRRCYLLKNFAIWCEHRGITRPQEITKPILERYQRYLFHFRSENGAPLSFRSQAHYLNAIQAYFHFLARHNLILYNPASDIDLPRCGRRLPRQVLTIEEVERILNIVDTEEVLGIRDRAILETLYSTGMRRMELLTLKIFDLDTELGTIMIREGKGKKDRMVPIGSRAASWLRRYMEEVRPAIVVEPDVGFLFLNYLGEPIRPNGLSRMVGKYVKAGNIGKKGSCHMFRHTMATLMLEGGADVRYIQQMLGHASLETTSIYTHVSIRKLQEVFLNTHPGAQLEKSPRQKPKESRTPGKARLFSDLAAEAEEETDEE